jgi:hypothetical protein
MPADFLEQLRRCGQSDEEVRRFIEDLALVRLRYVLHALTGPDRVPTEGELPNLLGNHEEDALESLGGAQSDDLDWTEGAWLEEAGLQPAWVSVEPRPADSYLHIDTAVDGDWSVVQYFLAKLGRASSEAKRLFPLLSRKARPTRLGSAAVSRADFAGEVQRLNRRLYARFAPPEILWSDSDGLQTSGVDPSWITDLEDPGEVYVHAESAEYGEWSKVRDALTRSLLSDKQQRILFPVLSRDRRPTALGGVPVTSEDLRREVGRLNGFLHAALAFGADLRRFQIYQADLRIHGASQNFSGRIGTVGAVVAVLDALRELDPAAVSDVLGTELPEHVRTPLDIYEYLRTEGVDIPRAMLLRNHRAIIFSSDPDIAIIQSLDSDHPFRTAREAHRAWEEVRRHFEDARHKLLAHAVGEVKTATDPQNTHERLALGSRETRDETGTPRFLLMAVLPARVLELELEGRRDGDGPSARRRRTRFSSRETQRFSSVFNLYFVWGYDGARKRHPEHWEEFKRTLTRWCDLR